MTFLVVAERKSGVERGIEIVTAGAEALGYRITVAAIASLPSGLFGADVAVDDD